MKKLTGILLAALLLVLSASALDLALPDEAGETAGQTEEAALSTIKAGAHKLTLDDIPAKYKNVNGTLVFFDDFDGLEPGDYSGSNGVDYTGHRYAYTTGAIQGGNFTLRSANSSMAVAEYETGNNAVLITPTANGPYVFFNEPYLSVGNYVVFADVAMNGPGGVSVTYMGTNGTTYNQGTLYKNTQASGSFAWQTDCSSVLLLKNNVRAYRVNLPSNSNSNPWYFDNLRIYQVQEYTVTYLGENDQVFATDKGYGMIPYTPNAASPSGVEYQVVGGDIWQFKGWARQESPSLLEETMELTGDVMLVPVWEPASEIKLFDRTTMKAVAGTTFTATAQFPFTAFTVTSLGNTEATVTADTTAHTVTITSAGYAGEITAVMTTETLGDVNVTFYLYGGSKWKPGLNVYTGTTLPLDFEQMVDLADINPSSFILADNPVSTGNASAKTMQATAPGGAYHFAPISTFDAIEVARPMYFRVDKFSDYYSFVTVNGTGNIFKQLGVTADGWTTYAYDVNMSSGKDGYMNTAVTGVNGFYYAAQADGKPFVAYALTNADTHYQYLDNFMLVPGYKVTYMDEAGENELAVDYVKPFENGAAVTSYTPDLTLEGLEDAESVSLAEGGTPVSSVALENEDVVLYVKMREINAPITYDTCEIRTTNPGGLRFSAFLNAIELANTDEAGFIVARESTLDGDTNALVFPEGFTSLTNEGATKSGTTASGAAFVCGTGYSKSAGINRFGVASLNGEDGYRYTAVLVGMDSKEKYTEKFAARPYALIDGTYFYGAAKVQDIYTVAKALAEGGDTSDYVTNIVAVCEAE